MWTLREKAYEAHLADVKSAHAEAWKHVISENQRLQDLCERYRVALNPTVAKPAEGPPPSQPEDENTGSPWQRVLKREMKLQAEEAKKNFVKPVDAPIPVKEGATNAKGQPGEST